MSRPFFGFFKLQSPVIFFPWYNDEHKHSGIGLLTPKQVHYGLADDILAQRSQVLQAAFDKNANRFKGKCPQPPVLPKAAWINRPDNEIDFLNGLESESALPAFSRTVKNPALK